MLKVNCPACAGPEDARKTCATCNGKMEVFQEVFDIFTENQQKQENLNTFMSRLHSLDQNIENHYLFDDGNTIYQYFNGIYSEEPKTL